jgi:hypothetical protein
MKDQLVFDTTDVDTIADSDHVGSHTLAGDGTLITATGGALDVNIKTSDIQIAVDLVHTEDSIRLGDGTAFFTSTSENGDIALDVHISNSDLDIRDLVFATDKVDVSGSSVTVSATDLDIRDLVAASDSVSSYTMDGTGTAITSRAEDGGQALDVHVTGSGPLTVNDAALADTSIIATANTLAVASTSEDVVASPLADRKYLFVYNNDNRKMFIGGTGVTEASGFPISPGSYMELRAGDSADVEYVSAKASHAIRTLELS